MFPEGGIGAIDMQVALFETARGMTIKLLRTSVLPRRPNIHFYAPRHESMPRRTAAG